MTTNNAINNTFLVNPNASSYLAGPISLSQTNLTNLATTHILLIAAPGSGFAIIPHFVMTKSSTGTGYSGNSTMNFVNGSNTDFCATTATLGLSGTSIINSSVINLTASVATNSAINNQGFYIFNKGTALSGGNQTIKVWVRYFILELT